MIIDQNSVLQRYTPPPTRPRASASRSSRTTSPASPPRRSTACGSRSASVEIEGAVTLDPALFAPLYAGLVGRDDHAPRARRRAEGHRGDLPRQRLLCARLGAAAGPGDGTVRVVVYEFYIREVSIEGDVDDIRNLEERLQPYIDRMVEMRPVRISRLLRYALLMTDLAGLTIDAEFSKILEEPGAGRLVLQARLRSEQLPRPARQFRERRRRSARTCRQGPLQQRSSACSRAPSSSSSPTRRRRRSWWSAASPRPCRSARSGFAFGYDYAHIWSNPADDETSTPRPPRPMPI